MKDDRFRAFAVLVAVFLIGALIGVAGSYLWLKPSADTSMSSSRRYSPPSPNGQLSASPNGPRPEFPDFKLTSEQEQKLRKIWKETGDKLRSLDQEQRELRVEVEKKMEGIWEENDRRVRAELNEEQKAIFDPWIEEFRKFRGRLLRRMGPEPPRDNRMGPEPPRDNRRKPEIPKENHKRPPEQL